MVTCMTQVATSAADRDNREVSLSQMSSGWRGTTNRVMLSPDVGRLEIAVVTSDRVLPIARVT